MKFQVFIISLLFAATSQAIVEDWNVDTNLSNSEARVLVTPSFYNGVIHLSDLDTSATAGGAMFTISAPGRYYVADDLSLAPSNSRVAAIKISSSNVLLDLNSASIYQRAGNTATGLMGVEIDSNVANVRVRNGKIQGLQVSDATEQNAGVVVRSGSNNVFLEDLVVAGCNSDLEEVVGFLLVSCNNIHLTNCESNNNSNTTDDGTGSDNWCSGFVLKNSDLSDANRCFGCVLTNCKAIRNSSVSSLSFGFRLETAKYNRLINCTAINQITTSTVTGVYVAGFYAFNSIGDVFDHCVSVGATAGTHAGAYAAGFLLNDTCKYITIKNCVAIANDGGTGTGYGYNINSNTSYCALENNQALANVGTVFGYGFFDGASASTNMYVSNLAHGNGKADGTTIANYAIDPSGSGGPISFPKQGGAYNSYPATFSTDTFYNTEIS